METAAKILFDTYTSPNAQYEAVDDAQDGQSEWAKMVPLGTQWDNNVKEASNIFSLTEMENANKQAALKKAKQKHKQPKKSSDLSNPPFYDDKSFTEVAISSVIQ